MMSQDSHANAGTPDGSRIKTLLISPLATGKVQSQAFSKDSVASAIVKFRRSPMRGSSKSVRSSILPNGNNSPMKELAI